jgi:GntR family transcriptional regulator
LNGPDVIAAASPLPLYYKVSTVLRSRIIDGTYAEGEQIPTEDLLTLEFKVSKATVRQAVLELVQSGLVQRKQGKGTFVLPSVVHHVRQRYTGSRADLITETLGTSVRDVTVAQQAALPPRIAHMLELASPIGTVVHRTRELEGQVYCYTVNYLPSTHGRRLSRTKLLRQTLTGILRSSGVELGRSTSWIRADVVDPSVSDALEIPFGAPVLAVERLIQDPAGRPIEVVQSWYRSDIYQYTVEIDHQL